VRALSLWILLVLLMPRVKLRSGAPEPADPQVPDVCFAIVQSAPRWWWCGRRVPDGVAESEKGRGKDEGPQRKVTFAQPFSAWAVRR